MSMRATAACLLSSNLAIIFSVKLKSPRPSEPKKLSSCLYSFINAFCAPLYTGIYKI